VQRLVQFGYVAFAAFAVSLVASCGPSALRAHPNSPVVLATATRVGADAKVLAERESEQASVAWAEDLAPLRFVHTRGGDALTVRLYRADGSLDEEAATALDGLLDDTAADGTPRALDRRVLKLIVKAADHFHTSEILVVSSWREAKRPVSRGFAERPPGSRHAMGQAIDFMFSNVASGTLAKHLRTYARVGVGIYTHPRTRFVHLDVRDESFHWLDSSPPGRTWREQGITDRAAKDRDRAYDPSQDLPG
jgi:uncharacterized protein YcbK (DUF882 family)